MTAFAGLGMPRVVRNPEALPGHHWPGGVLSKHHPWEGFTMNNANAIQNATLAAWDAGRRRDDVRPVSPLGAILEWAWSHGFCLGACSLLPTDCPSEPPSMIFGMRQVLSRGVV